jgi:hypothetical protein
MEIRNIHGLPSSHGAIVASLEISRSKPDILVLLETMVTSPEKWQIPGYRLEAKFPAVESSSGGRPSGGAAAWVSNEYLVPINTAKVSTPPNCLALVFGDDKSGGLKGLLAMYRRYTDSEVELARFFEEAQGTILQLRDIGCDVIAAGDVNAHLWEDTKHTGKRGNLAGEMFMAMAAECNLIRITPLNVPPPAWTYVEMTEAQYDSQSHLDMSSGRRSIIDHVLIQRESEPTTLYHLNVADNMRSDHAGQSITVTQYMRDHGEAIRPAQLPRRSRLDEVGAERYAREAERHVAEWVSWASRSRERWKEPDFVADAISSLESTLRGVMDKVNPTSIGKCDTKSNRRRARNQTLDLLKAAWNGDAKEISIWRDQVRSEIAAEVKEEAKSTSRLGTKLSRLVHEGNTTDVWRSRKRLMGRMFKREQPRCFFNEKMELVWRKKDVLALVARETKKMCDPETVRNYESERQKKTRDLHSRIAKLGRQARDWIPSVEDAKRFAKYLYDTYKKRGACGRTGTTEEMFVLLGESNLIEILLLILQMLQACNTLPEHWRYLVVVLALKPGKEPQLLSSCRPLVLAEILMKGLERVIKYYQDITLLTRPLHASILAYRPGVSTGMALFVLQETCLQAKLLNIKVLLDVTDVKDAYGGTDTKRVEVYEWFQLGFRGQLWELARQLSGSSIYSTRIHGLMTTPQKQRGGLTQGKVLSPNKFKISMHEPMCKLEEAGA